MDEVKQSTASLSLLERVKESVYSVHTSYVYLLLPAIMIFGYWFSFILDLSFMMIFLTYGLIPKIDQFLKMDWYNPTHKQITQLENNQKFRIILYVTLILDWVFLIRSLNSIYNGQVSFLEVLPLTFMLFNLSATGFLVAHELFHKLNYVDRIVGKPKLDSGTVHQIKNLYMHFTVQHLYGHHKWVATPEDPATARKGITLYEFVPKSIVGGFKSAFKINPGFVALSVVASMLAIGVVWRFYGLMMTFYFLVTAFGGVFILELINYIEHYGLQRKKLPDGSYEKVDIRHSWNAPHRISNYVFFKLQRHSDHHENSYKPYQTLCSYEDSPQLPHGYLVCMLMALFPQKWFDMMDPLVDQYRKIGKGTNLKALAIAEAKADDFVDQLYITIALITITEMVYKYAF